MSARFAELMALSASQTRQAEVTAQSLLAERRRKEEQKRKEQEEKERKEREQQTRLIKLRVEEERRERERKERAEEERRRREQLQAKKEAEQRDALLHGPKAGSRSNWGNKDGNRAARKSREGSEDSLDTGASALTREEKRQRKLQADLNRSFGSKRPSHAGNSKANRAFRGATIISTSTNPLELSSPANSHLSVKERLAAMPMVLTKLNTVKRDTRTIDEIVRDRQKARESKVLDGDEARGFNDWFGKSKKADSTPKRGTSTHSSVSPPPSRAATPGLLQTKPSATSLEVPTSGPSSKSPSLRHPPVKTTIRKFVPAKPGLEKETKASISSSRAPTKPPQSASKSSVHPTKSGSSSLPSRLSNVQLSNSVGKKRARSPSLSDSPPPPKRKTAPVRNDISSEIWKLFGKDRDRYVNNDVYSDEDDDMEADADAVRREELRSARLAKKEDELAEEEDRRHEEEKRRRRKEREMRERRG